MSKKNLSRRDFLRASALGSFGLALAACAAPAAPSSGDQAAAGDSAMADAERVTVRFHARIGAQEDALYEQQMPKFMEENPDIELVKESFPGTEFTAKITTMQAGGTLGDVIWSALGQAKIQFAYAQGLIQPIDDLVQSQDVDLSEWYEGCLEAITVEGDLLGLPFKAHPGQAVVYYNQNAFDDAGLDYPTPEWTMDDQWTMAAATTNTEDTSNLRYGYLPATNWKGYVTLMRAFGSELLNEDGSQVQLDSTEGLEATKWLASFFQNGYAPTPEQVIGNAGQMWSSGLLSTFQAGTWASNLGNTIGDSFEWMAAPNAIGPGGVAGSDYEVDAYCVTATTEQPAEAFEWVQYLCNQESGVLLGIIGGTVGGRPDVYGSEELLQFEYRQVFKEIMDNAMDSRITANWRQEEAEKAFDQLMQPVWVGEVEPDAEFIGSVAADIQDILDKPRP